MRGRANSEWAKGSKLRYDLPILRAFNSGLIRILHTAPDSLDLICELPLDRLAIHRALSEDEDGSEYSGRNAAARCKAHHPNEQSDILPAHKACYDCVVVESLKRL